MSHGDVAVSWSRHFGLARAPLFEPGEADAADEHHALLDGGYGSFALSVSERELWGNPEPAGWAWSSDIPHHITITPSKVAVLRWDRPDSPRVFQRGGVERSLDRFYDYLIEDRLRSNKSVVEHILGFFRRIRSLAYSAGMPDTRTTEIFLALLAEMIAPDRSRADPKLLGLSDDAFDLGAKLNQKGLAAAKDEVRRASGSLSLLELNPALAIRHSGGQLFQEAHFELLRAPTSLDLFGLIGAPDVKATGRGGTHYTPPALARMLAEQTLGVFGNLATRKELTICDPACGSGAFLHETLRALRRLNFDGQLTIIGQDVSPVAISMAKFALRMALRDWSPRGAVNLKLEVGDSLGELGIPASDLIIMNPPFVAFGSQTELQRGQIKAAMGGVGSARGDFSMAFIVRALEVLNPGGALGALFPESLLSLKAATPWREKLADIGDVRLLGSIGDFGLFTHALVQVACCVVRKGLSPANGELLAFVTGHEPHSTGAAFRSLRKLDGTPLMTPITEADWGIFPVPVSVLKTRATWRFPSPNTERALRNLEEAQLPTIGDLFKVHQGVQTGLNDALLLTEEEWCRLDSKERAVFRLATMSDSIQNGRIARPYYLFFPYTANGEPQFETEKEVEEAVPVYYKRFLKPYRDRLMARAAIRHARRTDWWGLMRPREWSARVQARIVSKFFAAEGGFVGDYDSKYIPVMGHAWFFNAALNVPSNEDISVRDLLSAYVAIFNSSVFVKLLSIYVPHVAGGQFDLSWRHVAPIPMPNLRELSIDLNGGRLVNRLAEQGRTIDLTDSSWRSKNIQLVSSLYGTKIIADL